MPTSRGVKTFHFTFWRERELGRVLTKPEMLELKHICVGHLRISLLTDFVAKVGCGRLMPVGIRLRGDRL